jgi:hypothetical protein
LGRAFDGRTGLIVLSGIGVPNLLNMGFPAAAAVPRCRAKYQETLMKLATPAERAWVNNVNHLQRLTGATALSRY